MENTSPRAEPVVGHAAFSYPWLNKKTVWGREKTTRQESLIAPASSRFIPAPLVIITTCIFLPSGSAQTAGSLGGSVQLMGETLIVSSFAKLFCLQFARSLSLCLCSLPLPPLSLYLAFLPRMKWMLMRITEAISKLHGSMSGQRGFH